MNFFLNDLFSLISEFYFITILSIIIIIAMILKNNYSIKELIISITDISIVSLIFLGLLYIYKYSNEIYISNFLLKDTLFLNSLKIIIIFISIIVFVISRTYYISRNVNTFELPLILLFSIFGIITTISSNDLILLYLALEMQSLSIYALVSSKTNSSISAEAGLKYFILGSFISGFILYSISTIYLYTGTTNIKSLQLLLYNTYNLNSGILTFSIILLVAGLLFKLSAAPLHNWTPDVFDGAPTIITVFIATAPKIGVFYLIVNLFYNTFYSFSSTWSTLLFISGIFSLIIGSFGGLYQIKLKRLLAYSTINNMGFILLGLSTNNTQSIEVGLFYIIIYIIISLGIFTVIASFTKYKTNKEIIYISQIGDIYRTSPLLGTLFALNLFSLVGVPPLAGFLTKFYLLLTLVDNKLYIVVLFALIMSVITSFYYIRLINIVFFSKEVWTQSYLTLKENSIFLLYIISVINLTLILNVEHVLKILSVISISIF